MDNLVCQLADLGGAFAQEGLPIVAVFEWNVALEHFEQFVAQFLKRQFPPRRQPRIELALSSTQATQ